MEERCEAWTPVPAPNALRPAPPWAARYPDPPEEEDPTVTLRHGEDLRTTADKIETFASEELASEPILVAIELAIVYGPDLRYDWLKPDLLVVRGASPYVGENVYALLEEKLPVTLVLELASRKTFKNDQKKKKDTYERIGVREYVLFDPVGGLYKPSFQAYRLNERGQFVFVARDDRFESELGVTFAAEDGRLHLYNTRTGARLLRGKEHSAERRQARRLAFDEAQRRHAAELAWQAEVDERREADERAWEADERAREADERAQREASARREADERAQREASARREADERAQREASARREADERAQLEARQRLTDKQDAVARILMARFGQMPSELEQLIREADDLALLDRWFNQALVVASLDAFPR